jgi:flavin reductase (DIM6/NTAB) family NADH-FMN oxidoreductase RutF
MCSFSSISRISEEWLSALSLITNGIYILTTSYKNTVNGMIASWVTQVSFSPVLILVAIHPNRYTHELISKSKCFTLNIISVNHKELVSTFKIKDIQKRFSGIRWRPGKNGSPVLEDAIAYLECNLKEVYTPGNHTLFIGELLEAGVKSIDRPLSTIDYGKVYIGNI